MTDSEKLEKLRSIISKWPKDSVTKRLLKVIDAGPEKPKSPGDELAAEVVMLAGEGKGAILAAVERYRSRRANEPTDEHLRTAGVPDEKKIARFLLDTLTGGALSSLVCMVRDEVIPRWPALTPTRSDHVALDNLRANLRALGEELP